MPPVDNVDRTLDCLKLLCPVPIIKISKERKKCNQARPYSCSPMIPAESGHDRRAKQTGNELLGIEQEGKVFKFYIRKK